MSVTEVRAQLKSQRLPESLAPRGLGRVQAALYFGISVSKFDQMVTDGRMPKPKRIDGRRVWDRWRLDEAFDALPDDDIHAKESRRAKRNIQNLNQRAALHSSTAVEHDVLSGNS